MARNTTTTSDGGDEDVTAQGGTTAVAPSEPVNQADAQQGHVVYKGLATHRRITRAQWQTAGVEGQSTVEFTPQNQHQLPTRDFTGAALEVLRNDGSFLVPSR